MKVIHLREGKKTRRILEDGKLQEWSDRYNCWLGMKRKGPQFDMTPDEIAEEWEHAGWKRASESEQTK